VNPSRPAADASVRIAWAADAEAIAHLQVKAWRRTYADILPKELLAALDEQAFADQWRQSLATPADARNRCLLGLAAGTPVACAATEPSDDPDSDPIRDGAISAFHVDPDATGLGHGSRLLHACIDTLRADGFTRAVMWLFSTDDPMRRFLTESGWAPDGAHRELDLHGDGAVRVKQVRLHCSIDDA